MFSNCNGQLTVIMGKLNDTILPASPCLCEFPFPTCNQDFVDPVTDHISIVRNPCQHIYCARLCGIANRHSEHLATCNKRPAAYANRK